MHFGSGNIFRGFIAVLQQRLLESKDAEHGIVAAETFDAEIIDKVFEPFGNRHINVVLGADGSLDAEIVASVAESVALRQGGASGLRRLGEHFAKPGLQMVSLTLTEKGYWLRDAGGALLPSARRDFEAGPKAPSHAMCVLAALLHERFKAGGHKVAVVSMDNISKNGDAVRAAVAEAAKAWHENGFVERGFLDYLCDKSAVSFPLTMIDKITPRPDDAVAVELEKRGLEGMRPLVTGKGTYIAPFVNSERPGYLVIEDDFPAGRPPLEKAGVYFTDRETVGKAESMKVATCLNPLHTAMSVYGCLLGYTRICEAMKDADIARLITRLGYAEGLPVAAEPGILSPKAFLDEVIGERLPNPFLPDSPQRIVTDTSQKVGIRFGETVKRYREHGLSLAGLTALPLGLAGWLRYLLAVDDDGKEMELSPDPMMDDLQAALCGIVWNEPKSYGGQLMAILKNPAVFGSDLTETALAAKIEEMFVALLSGKGAVRRTLRAMLD